MSSLSPPAISTWAPTSRAPSSISRSIGASSTIGSSPSALAPSRRRRLEVELALSELSAKERYRLLIGLVVPRPIAFITTRSEDGVVNAAPFSFFNLMGEDPPIMVVSLESRADGSIKDTMRNIRRAGEFVVNLVDEAIAAAMHQASAN